MGTSRSSLKGCGFPIIKVKNRKDGKKGTEKSCSSNRAPSSSASVSVSKGSSGGSDIKSKAGGRKPGLHPPAPAANGSSAKGTVVHRRTQEATGVASRKRNVNEKSSKEGGSTSRPAAGRTEGGSRDEGKERPPSGIAPQRSSWAKQNLPGGAASIGTGTSRAPPSTSRRSKGANSRRGTSSSASSTIGADRRSSSSFSSYLMTLPPSRPGSRGHPASRCDSAGQAGRQSFRMRRQPSTYGELHEIVAGQKLGSGAARGLVGESNHSVFHHYQENIIHLCRARFEKSGATAVCYDVVVHLSTCIPSCVSRVLRLHREHRSLSATATRLLWMSAPQRWAHRITVQNTSAHPSACSEKPVCS